MDKVKFSTFCQSHFPFAVGYVDVVKEHMSVFFPRVCLSTIESALCCRKNKKKKFAGEDVP